MKTSACYVLSIFLFLLIPESKAALFTVSTASAIQTALNTAASNGESDTVLIQNGTYHLTASLTYSSSEGYSITVMGQTSTVLNGNDNVRPLDIRTTVDNADIFVKNLTIEHGRGDYGGGIYLETTTADIVMSNCTVNDNTGTVICGGADIYSDYGDITVTNCSFERNSAPNTTGYPNGTAGGLFVQTDQAGTTIELKNSYFAHNSAHRDAGGAMLYPTGPNSTVTADSNTFENNTALEYGGGFWVRCPNSNAAVTFTHNTLTGNEASGAGSGGGSYFELEGGQLTAYGNRHSNNNAAWQGGGMWVTHNGGTINVHNNTFDGDTCTQGGGALYIYIESGTATVKYNSMINSSASSGGTGGGLSIATTSAALNVYKNTLYNNFADEGGDAYFYFDAASASISFYENILWGSSSPALACSGAVSVTATYCDIEGGTGESWFGTGCIDSNPLFANAANGDLNLTWANYPSADGTKSPCIDTGNPSSPEDADSSRADMGMYYFEQYNIWQGNVSSNWNTATNWSRNLVPFDNLSVEIPVVTTNYPNVTTQGNSCKKLTLKSGAQLTISSSGSLTILE